MIIWYPSPIRLSAARPIYATRGGNVEDWDPNIPGIMLTTQKWRSEGGFAGFLRRFAPPLLLSYRLCHFGNSDNYHKRYRFRSTFVPITSKFYYFWYWALIDIAPNMSETHTWYEITRIVREFPVELSLPLRCREYLVIAIRYCLPNTGAHHCTGYLSCRFID